MKRGRIARALPLDPDADDLPVQPDPTPAPDTPPDTGADTAGGEGSGDEVEAPAARRARKTPSAAQTRSRGRRDPATPADTRADSTPDTPARRGGRRPTGRRGRTIGLPTGLVEPLNTAAAAAGLTHGEWLIRAAYAVDARLPEVYPELPDAPPGAPPLARPARADLPPGRVPVNFRLTDPELAWLDQRAEQLGVPTRAEYVATVVQLGLEP